MSGEQVISYQDSVAVASGRQDPADSSIRGIRDQMALILENESAREQSADWRAKSQLSSTDGN